MSVWISISLSTCVSMFPSYLSLFCYFCYQILEFHLVSMSTNSRAYLQQMPSFFPFQVSGRFYHNLHIFLFSPFTSLKGTVYGRLWVL